MRRAMAPLLIAFFLIPAFSPAAENFSREQDVIYGRKYGTALTMDVFQPENPKGIGLIFVVSGGWFSSHAAISPAFVTPFLDRGYTVFAVVHGSQPKFTIPEIISDMHRATRFIRHHAEDYSIDPNQIGIFGASAGGHLSLMQGVAGTKADPNPKDVVDRESSRVQAVACFFPPTDFLNYGVEGRVALGKGVLKNFYAPFDFQKLVPGESGGFGATFEPVTDKKKRIEIGREISPIYHISEDDPPTLIIHGGADQLVPIQQAKLMIAALKKADIESKLVVREGAGHGWASIGKDFELLADWFDTHLKTTDAQAEAQEASAASTQ